MSNSIYKLERFYDDPRYEGFYAEFRMPGYVPSVRRRDKNKVWRAARFAEIWKPIKVTGRVRQFNDYPSSLGLPVFSPKAVEALSDLLEANGELLPLNSELGRYFVFNTTTIVDVLNLKKSQSDRLDIWRYAFFARKLKGLSIFRIPEKPNHIYVTEEFVRRAEAADLRGMDFKKVWPFPRGIDWWRVPKETTLKAKQRGLPRGRSVKGNSVAIHLFFTGKSGKETAADTKRINAMMDQLDALLVDPRSTAPSVGQVEGVDRGISGKCRLMLSCPDADALIAFIRPWLSRLKWPGRFSVGKRYANFADVRVKQVPAKL